MLAVLINWHTVGHVTLYTVLGLGTIWGILATIIAKEIANEADNWKDRAQSWEIRWNNHQCARRDNAALQEMRQYALDWQQRYEMQVEQCRVAHMDRPLPTMPLDATNREELEEALPF